MRRVLTDEEICALLTEQKSLPENWKTRLRVLPKTGFRHVQRELEIPGGNGKVFRIVLRQNTINTLDFSIILMFRDADGTEFRLCRYNGKHPSEHTNRLEKLLGKANASFRNQFHIHTATERYQQASLEIDGYAEATGKYSSFDSALTEFLASNGFQTPLEELPLFDGQGDPR
jgi:hypothetical protein